MPLARDPIKYPATSISTETRAIVTFLEGKQRGSASTLRTRCEALNKKLEDFVGAFTLVCKIQNWAPRTPDQTMRRYQSSSRSPAQVAQAVFSRLEQLVNELKRLAPRPDTKQIEPRIKEIAELTSAVLTYAWHMAHALGLTSGVQQPSNSYDSGSTARFQGRVSTRALFDGHAYSPNDIKQGDIGTCWLLAALAAMARTDPDKLAALITDNGDGTFTVALDRFGRTARIRTDGTFPSKGSGRKVEPRFAQSGDDYRQRIGGPIHRKFPRHRRGKLQRELWPMLLEKAVAIEMGNDWQNVNFGDSRNSLQLLGGRQAKPQLYETDKLSPSQIQQRLSQADRDGNPVVLGTRHALPNQEGIGKQLMPSHAYAYMGLSGNRVKLRDPYGKKVNPTVDEVKLYFMVLFVGHGI